MYQCCRWNLSLCPNWLLSLYMIKSQFWKDHVSNWLLSRIFDLILSFCSLLTPFKTIWPDFALSSQLTPFKTIWHDFCIVYSSDSFQVHMTWFLYCVYIWLLSRPCNSIFALCIQLTPFKTIWANFIIVYPIDSFQDHMTWLLSLCTQLTPFKTIWPNFIIVYPIDSFQDHMTLFYHCVPKWLPSRPYDLIFALCTQFTPFNTIWPNQMVLKGVNGLERSQLGTQYTSQVHMVLKGVIWVHNDKIGSYGLERSQLGTKY